MRWSQSWMLLALITLIEKSDENWSIEMFKIVDP